MRKILILGGSYQHIKIVQAAKKLGLKVYVTDYLPVEQSPAKALADVPLMYNITDIDALEKFCIREGIYAIIGPYLDVTQRPYQQLCERLNCPCFGTKLQHAILTDKILFKNFCQEHNLPVIKTYTEKDIETNPQGIKFPVFVKPNDSRGSRGQSICNNITEIISAIEYAKQFSNSKKVIIEQYIQQVSDIQLVYIVINGEPILIRVEDRYLGSAHNGLNKLCIATVNPSDLDDIYRKKADSIVKSMIRALNLKNAPVFIQAFFDGNIVMPYDPGIRFPGDNFDDLYKAITNIDIPKILVEFALTGEIKKEYAIKFKQAKLNKPSAMILPCLKPGKIADIRGYEELKNNKNIISMYKAYNIGDIVPNTKNIRQRFGELCIMGNNIEEVKNTISTLFEKLEVLDDNGESMLIEKFDINTLREIKK